MDDASIRTEDAEALARINNDAARHGLPRSEYLRRGPGGIAFPRGRTTLADFKRLADLASDLLDDEVMAKAWTEDDPPSRELKLVADVDPDREVPLR